MVITGNLTAVLNTILANSVFLFQPTTSRPGGIRLKSAGSSVAAPQASAAAVAEALTATATHPTASRRGLRISRATTDTTLALTTNRSAILTLNSTLAAAFRCNSTATLSASAWI